MIGGWEIFAMVRALRHSVASGATCGLFTQTSTWRNTQGWQPVVTEFPTWIFPVLSDACKVHVSVWLCQSWTTFSLNCVRAVRLSDALCQAQSLQRSTHSLSFAQRTARCMAKLATFLKRSRDFVFECFNVDLCIKCVVATRDIQLKILWFCNRHGAIKLNYEFLSTRRCFQELIVSYFITFFSNIPMYILRYCHVRFHSNLPSQYVIIHSVL